ncbi:uncharacterized protein LOC110614285 isoform X3 [Manihot esculenta]|uniref:uncharacterized protein LOC110614285 isoform X2 n=1 Tax=Manihot esculenta TaxID=3983 RepID=UPI000B5D2389|nr:uncharacterized protein LOC110614285 isoform X2 [Manihot esculenta]XP_021611480.1 uncharacterized protein LOC110614285 isoform X3 [Manihot esculenta]
MTESEDRRVSRRQSRLKRDPEDQCENLNQKCLKMDNPANDVNKNDTKTGRLPFIFKHSYSGEEKCTIMEGCKFITGEKGLLLRIEPLDKDELEKLETPEEKHAKEKLIARQCKSYAKAALAHYNRQEDRTRGTEERSSESATSELDQSQPEDVDFELVKVLNCKTSCDFGLWHHINFEAKPRNFKCSPKLFFAELYGNALCVTCCCMLKPKGSDASSLKGCYFCRSLIHHPASGFRAGTDSPLRFGKYGGIPVNRCTSSKPL